MPQTMPSHKIYGTYISSILMEYMQPDYFESFLFVIHVYYLMSIYLSGRALQK